MIRPAGMSDEDDSDFDFDFAVPKSGHSFKKDRSRPAGGLTNASSSGTNLNAKQRRSQKYWEAKRAIEREEQKMNLPPVDDPKSKPESQQFFQFAKQANMNLRQDLNYNGNVGSQNHILAVDRWNLKDVSLEEPHWSNSTRDLGVPLCTYRGIPIFYVDASNFDNMTKVMTATSTNELAVDLELNNSHSFLGMTALLQVATRKAVFLIDPFSCFLKIKKHMQPLLEDPRTLKIMFGMGNDCKQFKKDFGIHAVGIVDLQLLYNEYRADHGRNLIGLTQICSQMLPRYENVKACTLADWRRRPLTKDMITYAASDVVVLFELWDCFKNLLSPALLEVGIRHSKRLLKTEYNRRTFLTSDEELKKKNLSIVDWSQKKYDTYCLLHQWRERYAAIVDENPSDLLPIDVLIKICNQPLPATTDDLTKKGIPEVVAVPQTQTLLKIIHGDGNELFMRIKNCQCHNCLLIGHAAVHCPFPPNKDRKKEYYKTHPEEKKRQQMRRNANKERNKLKRLQKSIY